MKRLVPFDKRIVVKRDVTGKTIGKEGIIVQTEKAQKQEVEVATIIEIPKMTPIRKLLLENATAMAKSICLRGLKDGDPHVPEALEKLESIVHIASLKIGDRIMLSNYVGMTYDDDFYMGRLTIVDGDDAMAMYDRVEERDYKILKNPNII